MAIESVNLTVPGGDTPRSAFTKLNSNFSNTSHAASRLVGEASGNLMQVGAYGLGTSGSAFNLQMQDMLGRYPNGFYTTFTDATGWPADAYKFGGMLVVNRGPDTHKLVIGQKGLECFSVNDSGLANHSRILTDNNSTSVYASTTASGANMVVDSTGKIMRASSSERYKDIIADLELDDEHYADAMSLNPIIYRSKSEADNPDYHYYSFSAEALGAYDPAFTLWRETETVTDADGNVTEQPLAERQAEGINLNAIVAFLHATNVKQGKLIESLQDQIDALKPVE